MTLMICVLIFQTSAWADNDKPITVNELPVKAQRIIEQNFADDKVAYVTMDDEWSDKDYNVRMVNGNKIEFDSKGDWKEIKCRYTQVPTSLVPKKIVDFVSKNHAGNKIVGIDRNNRKYEVKLDNQLEITFDTNLNFRGYDD